MLVTQALATVPGDTWQQRWLASGCDTDPEGHEAILTQLMQPTTLAAREVRCGIDYLMTADVIRPSYQWLIQRPKGTFLNDLILDNRGGEKLKSKLAASGAGHHHINRTAGMACHIMLQTGKNLDAITGQDILNHRDTTAVIRASKPAKGWGWAALWKALTDLGVLPPTPTFDAARMHGQLSPEQLVDQYEIADTPVRALFIRYLQERATSMDYNSLQTLANSVVGNFWADIERHHPSATGAHLKLPKDVVSQWMTRLTERGPAARQATLIQIRALYLDIGQLAHDDPYWAAFAAPVPFPKTATNGHKKVRARAKARLHQKVRTITPQMPKLLKSVDEQRRWWADLLAASRQVEHGEQFTFAGVQYTRKTRNMNDQPLAAEHVVDSRDNTTTNLTKREEDAFWGWAVVNTLHYTGIRQEELLELTATALTKYRLPGTNETVLVLQIVPSKTDQERILLVDVELAHVLAVIKRRIADPDTGRVPVIERYDQHEREHTPPMPFLFQHSKAGTSSTLSTACTNSRLHEAVKIAEIRDANGAPVHVTAHDFRRVFITDAVSSNLPVHIVARMVGHSNISTTQVYIAVNDDDTMRHFQAFVNARRKLRPEEEYRAPTEDELAEYEKHFLMRKVELGSCARAYGTDCQHEHACIRCSMLRPDPAQRPRLEEIKRNLEERLVEAHGKGWLGEIEGIEISLSAAQEKLSRMTTIVNLQMPSIRASE